MKPLVHFTSDNAAHARAFKIAMGDVVSNIAPARLGLIDPPDDVLMAGLDYPFPWTRDAAINAWNGVGLLDPNLARNTLRSMLLQRNEGLAINDHQYWDAIIWATGAWHHYLLTGDRAFLAEAVEAVAHSLKQFEADEFDPERGLFRGGACTADGVNGYPDVYVTHGGSTCIEDWPAAHPDLRHPTGGGLPMHALSTNCLYYQGYVAAGRMAIELGCAPDPEWAGRAEALRNAINRHFWRPEAGCYRFLVDPLGDCDHQDLLGHAFALLFGVADDDRARQTLDAQTTVPAGVPVAWPDFERCVRVEGDHYGRHSACVWPPFEAIWASAAARHRRADLVGHVLGTLADHACRDNQFVEIYHPTTGAIYGGIQEMNNDPGHVWDSCPRQTWSATGYLRIVFDALAGMRFTPEGLSFQPMLVECSHIRLTNLRYRAMTLDIEIEGAGERIAAFSVNGRTRRKPFIPAKGRGRRRIRIEMADDM